MGSFILGYDIGSSSVKAAIVDSNTKQLVSKAYSPKNELITMSSELGWAEQDPKDWWNNLRVATSELLTNTNIDPRDIKAIGIAYQMHGLVLIDKDYQILRPAIIWSDSRSILIGNAAMDSIGKEICFSHLLNSPGNFTASKLKWVKDNEPCIYNRIYKMLLPGDYIALLMTGKVTTTIQGLSEAILWDFKEKKLANFVLDELGISSSAIPDLVPSIGVQGILSTSAAKELGLQSSIPISYRSGDQPNNAMSLNSINPGEIAASGGTSGVLYAVVDEPIYDPNSRVNGFAHVNYCENNESIGVLLCINGAGSQYSWIRKHIAIDGVSYDEMEKDAVNIPVGSDGLKIFPFGNGAERMFENEDMGARIIDLEFNRHTRSHIFRAGLEGIAFSFAYGIEILREMGIEINKIRVADDNLFRSSIFSVSLATLIGCEIEVFETTGAAGAAVAAAVGIGLFTSLEDAFAEYNPIMSYHPADSSLEYTNAYLLWKSELA